MDPNFPYRNNTGHGNRHRLPFHVTTRNLNYNRSYNQNSTSRVHSHRPQVVQHRPRPPPPPPSNRGRIGRSSHHHSSSYSRFPSQNRKSSPTNRNSKFSDHRPRTQHNISSMNTTRTRLSRHSGTHYNLSSSSNRKNTVSNRFPSVKQKILSKTSNHATSGRNSYSSKRNEAQIGTSGTQSKTNNIPSAFQEGRIYLNFLLETVNLNEYASKYKIDAQYKKKFLQMVKFGSEDMFSSSIDNWPFPADTDSLMETSKQAVLMADIKGSVGIRSVEKILFRRLDGMFDSGGYGKKRMTFIYCMYLIMIMETINGEPKRKYRPLCQSFETYLSDPKNDKFRKLVTEAPPHRKQELYSLRCKLDPYFSQESLEFIDRDNFWVKVGQQTEEDYDDSRKDSLGTVQNNIDIFLNVKWLVEFPINESDKRKFTEKYSVENPSGKSTVYLYDKSIEFSDMTLLCSVGELFPLVTKEKLIDVAKEVFYIEKVFGKKATLSIAEIIITKMAKSSNTKEGYVPLAERLIALLLIHIIVCAESTQTSYRNKPKEERPFCSAFANHTFVQHFKDLVASFKSKSNKKKLFWMRLVWNACLSDEYLLKIDENHFWRNIDVKPSALPTQYILKRQTLMEVDVPGEELAIIAEVDRNALRNEEPIVVVYSSEDEDSQAEISLVGSTSDASMVKTHTVNYRSNSSSSHSEDNNSLLQANKYVVSFLKLRQTWWTKRFPFNDESTQELRHKYDFSDSTEEELDLLDLSIKMFRKSILKVFPDVEIKELFNVTREAFYLSAEFGFGFVYDAVDYLTLQMLDGFEIPGPPEWKLTSRLIAFLIIHFIRSIESIEPYIIPSITEKSFETALEEQEKTSESTAALINDIKNKEIKKKLKFLALSWTVFKNLDETKISKRISDKFRANWYKEAFLINNIIEFSIKAYHSSNVIFNKNYGIGSDDESSNSNCSGHLSVVEISSDSSTEASRIGQSRNSKSQTEQSKRKRTKEKKKRKPYKRIVSFSSESE